MILALGLSGVPSALAQESAVAQWQLTLDVIKSKAQHLLDVNNQLTQEANTLSQQMQMLGQTIEQKRAGNDGMRQLLKERHGKTDQQIRIEELTKTLKAKKALLASRPRGISALQKEEAQLQRQIDAKKIKVSELETQRNTAQQPPAPSVQEDLNGVRAQLEQEKANEVAIEQEVEDFKKGQNQQQANEGGLAQANRELQSRLDVLRQQKAQQQAQPTGGQDNKERYYELQRRKSELDDKIRDYERRIDQMKDSLVTDISWSAKKKKLIHDMVQKDARNQEMREKINDLREDVEILHDHVDKLERRVNLGPSKSKKK